MRLLPAVLVGVLLAGSGCAAVRNNQKARKVHALNDEALADLKSGNARQAQKKLNEALQEVQKNELGAHTSAAQTHMNLGVVLASGLNQRHRAVSEMMAALAISPRIEPPSDFRNAKVDRAFALAKGRQTAAESAPAPAKAAPPPPAPPPVPAPLPAVAEAPAAPAGKGKRARNRRGKSAEASPAPAPASAPAPAQAPAPTQPAPTVADTAPPPAITSAPAAEEAAVPSQLPEPISCPLPDRVPPGQPVPVWCGIEADLRAKSATLFVRPREAPDFVALPMTRSPRGWWGATINGDMVAAGLLQFYVQAEGGSGTRVASSGDAYSPNILLVQAGARRAPAVITQAVLDGEDEGGDEPVAVEEPLADKGGFDWSRVFVSLQAGTGWGWHQESALEFRQDITVPSGTAFAGLVHVLPEIGYRLSERWAVSLQTRHQFLPNEGDTGGRPGRPARAANAALLRLLHTRPLTDRFSIMGSLALGGGEGFRMALGPVPNRGRSGSDSVRGGPLLVGAGGGVGFDVTPRLAVVAELRALVGLPDVAAIGEFNVGLRYAFGTLTP